MKNQTIKENGITRVITVGPVTVDTEKGLYKSDYQKDKTLSVMFRQVINTHSTYPAARVSSDKQNNLFSDEEFGFDGGQEFDSVSNRVAFMDVPEGTTIAQVQAKISANACIYKCLANRPVLTSNQMSAIQAGLRTIDQFANTQAIRYPENEQTLANGTAGQLILDADGKVQYRAQFFSNTEKADEDERGGEYYLSPELKAELAGVMPNARIVADQQL